MSIKRTIITTLVALALVAVVAPAVTHADALSDLQAQVQALLAQIAQLQGTSTTTMTTTGTGACAGVTFARNLTVGSTGTDVKCLQVLLNTNGYTVATTGAGSSGHETSYFGPATLKAVKAFQIAKGWAPANQVGPLTRGALNALLGTVGTTTGGGTTVVPTGAGLQVMLAADNPAAGIVVAGQGLAPLARYVFVNGDNAPVNVTSLSIARVGVSADADLANVYLLQGATRLTDAASVSTGNVNFNGGTTPLFTVPAGSSVEITVASDICSTTSCSTIVGQTLGVSVMSATSVTSNASSVKGTFPVNGNLFTVSNASLASVTLGSSTSSPSTNTNLTPQLAYPIWQSNVVIGTRAVNLTRIAFKLIGSIYSTDLQNFVLNIDGVNVGSAVASEDSNGYVTFNLMSAPYALQTGTRVVKVLADINNGSSRYFTTSIRVAADANFVDSQYGVNIAPTTQTGGAGTSFVTSDTTTGQQTIASGTLTIQKTITSPSGNIVNNASNADIGDFTLTAAGEPVKITDLYVRAIFTNNASVTGADLAASGITTDATKFKLRNGAIYANGVQIGSTSDLSPAAAGTHFGLGSSLIVTPGKPVTLTVKADIYDNAGSANDVDATDTIVADLVGQTASNAQGVTSYTSLKVPNTTDVKGNTLTVSSGGLTLAQYTAWPTGQQLVANGQSMKLADFVLSANTTEAINLNTIKVGLSGTLSATNVTNLYVTYGTGTTTSTPVPSDGTDANQYSVNYSLPTGNSIDLSVYGTITQGVTSSSNMYMNVLVSGTTANSGAAVSTGGGSDVAGQNFTLTSGTISAAPDAGTPLAGVVSGGQTITAAKFRVSASYDNFTVTEMKVTVPAAASSAVIQSAMLVDDATGSTLATQGALYSGSTYYFTGMNLAVPHGTYKTVDLKFTLATPDSTLSTDQLDVKGTLTNITYINGSGVQTSLASVSAAGNDIYVFKSVPTFTADADAYTTASAQALNLKNGSETLLYGFQVTAPSTGEVDLKQLKFNVQPTNSSSGTADALSQFKLYRNNVQIPTSSVAIMKTDGTDLTGANSITDGANTVVVLFKTSTDEAIGAGVTNTYTLTAVPANFGYSSTYGYDSVSVQLLGNDTVASTYVYDFGTSSSVHTLATSATGAATANDNLIWSDHSASNGHASSVSNAGSSADWANSMGTYLGLPLSAQGLSVSQ